MMTIEIDVSSLKADIAKIKQDIDEGILMGVVGKAVVDSYLPDVFSTDGAAAGTPWQHTIRGEGILRDTGTMAKSFYCKTEGSVAIIGNTQVYFKTHELGMTIRAKNKPYLVFTLRGAGSTATSKDTKKGMKKAARRNEKLAKKMAAGGDEAGAARIRESGKATGQVIRKKEVHIPRRSMLAISEAMLDVISKQTAAWVNANWGRGKR